MEGVVGGRQRQLRDSTVERPRRDGSLAAGHMPWPPNMPATSQHNARPVSINTRAEAPLTAVQTIVRGPASHVECDILDFEVVDDDGKVRRVDGRGIC